MIRNDYDVIVVGAGPAGSSAARTAAEKNLRTLLIDRKLEIGVPNKCGEFLPSLEEMKKLTPNVNGLERIFDPPEDYIVNRTKYVRFIFPKNREVVVPFKGVVVERKLYDKYLAAEAARAGAEVSPMTRFLSMLKDGRGIRAKRLDSEFEISSRVIIGADGTCSKIAKSVSLPVSRDPLDFSVGFQYEMVRVEHDSDYVDMYFGREYAPGTYAWIIPKGEDIANVGTGVRIPFMIEESNIRDYQRNFITNHPVASKKLKKATPTAFKAGYIPVGGPLVETCKRNVLVVGDAAGQTIPTVGGGVPTALICGDIAGRKVAEHVNEGEALTSYDYTWRRLLGETFENSLKLRKISDLIFRSDKVLDLVLEHGWLDEEAITNLIFCRINAKMKLAEKTLFKLLSTLKS